MVQGQLRLTLTVLELRLLILVIEKLAFDDFLVFYIAIYFCVKSTIYARHVM